MRNVCEKFPFTERASSGVFAWVFLQGHKLHRNQTIQSRKPQFRCQQLKSKLSRIRAAYWDVKNNVGEPVASGVYFYTLSTESTRDSVTTGDFTATRKMLIRK